MGSYHGDGITATVSIVVATRRKKEKKKNASTSQPSFHADAERIEAKH